MKNKQSEGKGEVKGTGSNESDQRKQEKNGLTKEEKQLEEIKAKMEELKNEKGKCLTIEYLNLVAQAGNMLHQMKNYQIAIPYLQEAKQLANFINQNKIQRQVLFPLALDLFYAKKYDESIDNFNILLQLQKKENKKESEYQAQILNNIGASYFGKNQYNKALQYYQQAEQMLTKIGIKQSSSLALYKKNIASIYKYQKQYDLFEKFSLQALNVWKNLKQPQPQRSLDCQFSLIQTYYQMGKYEQCVKQLYQNFIIKQLQSQITKQQSDKAAKWMLQISQKDDLSLSIYRKALKIVEKFWKSDQLLETKEILKKRLNEQ